MVVAAVGAFLLLGSNGSAEGLEVSPPADVSEASDVDTSLLDGFSSAASPAFDIEADDPNTPHELRFDLPKDFDSTQAPRLVAATRSAENEMWALTQGAVQGDQYVVQTPHLSLDQLRLLNVDISLPSKSNIERALGARANPPSCASTPSGLHLQVTDPAEILLRPCLDSHSGQALVRVANNRALAQKFALPGAAGVLSTQGRILTEAFYDELYQVLPGRETRLLPGAGQVAIALNTLPVDLRFAADPSATFLDIALTAVSKGKSKQAELVPFAKCAFEFSDSISANAYRSPTSVSKTLAQLIGACGETLASSGGPQALANLGFALGLPKSAYSIWDLGRAVAVKTAEVHVSALQPALLPAVVAASDELGKPGISCGLVEGIIATTGTAVAVQVGVARGELPCPEARELVSGYIASTAPCSRQGAGTCVRPINDYDCLAPTAGYFPLIVECFTSDIRVVGLDASATLPSGGQQACGTPKGVDIPGPFDVQANFDCAGAQSLAKTETSSKTGDNSPLLPFLCSTRVTGYETALSSCHFGDAQLSYATGA
jgi:hypothetical protein